MPSASCSPCLTSRGGPPRWPPRAGWTNGTSSWGSAEGGLPEPLYLRLGSSLGSLPADAPEVPEGLTHLWITTEWPGSPLIGWDVSEGWRSHQV